MDLNYGLEDCTVVWLCPLEIELRSAIKMLDETSNQIPNRSRGQNVVYTIGKIGHHKVALVGYYQEQGLAASGSMVAEVMRDLPNLELGLLVGIAGGIPSSERDIRLGDVVVAVPEANHGGVVGYDLGKVHDNGSFELKHWSQATHPLLRSVINVVRARDHLHFWHHMKILDQHPEFGPPASRSSDHDAPEAQKSKRNQLPIVHYGTILSGNSVIKSKDHRDQLAQKYGGIAVEMEAAGILTRLPVAVIRGISDFADANKTKEWQPYAAIAAAAYAKEILLQLPISGTTKFIQPPGIFADQDFRLTQALPETWAFVGRDTELSWLQETLKYPVQPSLRKIVLALWGLHGVGKSQLASKFIGMQRTSHPERELFWINGASQETFEQSVLGLYGSRHHSSSSGHIKIHEQRSLLISSFINVLNEMQDSRWLMVIDDVNENSIGEDFNVHELVRRLKRGCILMISDRRDVVERYYQKYEVKGLHVDNAVELLQSQIDDQLIQSGDLEAIASSLKGFPLSLRMAIATISRYRYTTTQYLDLWRSGEILKDHHEMDESMSQSLNVSFDELEKRNPAASKLLTLFAFLDHRDLWFELCSENIIETSSEVLDELSLQADSFYKIYPELADLSFIELKVTGNGQQRWEMHPAVKMIAQRRVVDDEQHYIRCAISIVAATVPRSYEEDFWEKTRRLESHADQCWRYVKRGKCGQGIQLRELDRLARLFRHLGRSELASEIYRMVENGIRAQRPDPNLASFLADVYTNLGLTMTSLRDFGAALEAFQKSWDIRSQLGTLTPDVTVSILYNKSIVYTMTGRLDEAEKYLKEAAAYFGRPQEKEDVLLNHERKRLYVRILNDLGEVHLLQNLTQQAVRIFEYLLSSQRTKLGEAHPTIVAIKLNLARGYNIRKDFERSHELLSEVVDLYTNWWGTQNCDTMRAMEELALTYTGEGKQKVTTGQDANSCFDQAEIYWKQVLECYRTIYGVRSEAVERVSKNLQYLAIVRDG